MWCLDKAHEHIIKTQGRAGCQPVPFCAQPERVAWLPFPPAGPPDERTGVSTAHRLFVIGAYVEDVQACSNPAVYFSHSHITTVSCEYIWLPLTAAFGKVLFRPIVPYLQLTSLSPAAPPCGEFAAA